MNEILITVKTQNGRFLNRTILNKDIFEKEQPKNGYLQGSGDQESFNYKYIKFKHLHKYCRLSFI